MPIISGRGRYKQEDPKAEVISAYTASWRSVWDTLDPVLKQKKMRQTKKSMSHRGERRRKGGRQRLLLLPVWVLASTTWLGTTNDNLTPSDKKTAEMKIIMQKIIRNAKMLQFEHISYFKISANAGIESYCNYHSTLKWSIQNMKTNDSFKFLVSSHGILNPTL